ncbi:MAG: roadblock/LC7 domain-containing protein [Rhizobacter sp.]|nr:roadblock/LC7 domain-containing protein [Chlorobiales bacterium]
MQFQILEILSSIQAELPDVSGYALVSSDGRIIHHDWKGSSVDTGKIGAIASALLGLGKKSIEILASGDFQQVVLQSTEETICVYSAGSRTVLIVSMNNTGNLGMLNHICRKKADEIEELTEKEKL